MGIQYVYTSRVVFNKECSFTLALTDSESQLIERIARYLDAKHPAESATVRQRIAALEALCSGVSRLPLVEEILGMQNADADTDMVLQTIGTFSISHGDKNLPDRIRAVRNCLSIKFKEFSEFSQLVQNNSELSQEVLRVIFSTVCTFTAEEVFFSLLEDQAFPTYIKLLLARELVSSWDTEVDFLLSLKTLWTTREITFPAFGSMIGSYELVRMLFSLGADWRVFCASQFGYDSVQWAFQEFSFGLSYEEINQVQAELNGSQGLATDFKDVSVFLGNHQRYAINKDASPLRIYDFFLDRKETAEKRKKIGIEGPWETLEELFIKFCYSLR